MKIWIDDVRPAPKGYVWCKSVNEAKDAIKGCERNVWWAAAYKQYHLEDKYWIKLIDLGYDAGDYTNRGSDYTSLLDWLEETGRNYPIRFHSKSPVDAANIRTTYEPKPRCSKCVYELYCSKDKDNERECPDYKRDAPDGGYYG